MGPDFCREDDLVGSCRHSGAIRNPREAIEIKMGPGLCWEDDFWLLPSFRRKPESIWALKEKHAIEIKMGPDFCREDDLVGFCRHSGASRNPFGL
jgi:hypothetical protein